MVIIVGPLPRPHTNTFTHTHARTHARSPKRMGRMAREAKRPKDERRGKATLISITKCLATTDGWMDGSTDAPTIQANKRTSEHTKQQTYRRMGGQTDKPTFKVVSRGAVGF